MHYIRILIGFILTISGCNLTTSHFSNAEKSEREAKVDDFEKLVASPKEKLATLDSVYHVTTLKVLGARVKMYTVNYFFTVDDRRYSGSYSMTEEPHISFLKIKYLEEDPSVNSAEPEKDLESFKNAATSHTSLYFGLLFMPLGVILIFSSIKTLRKNRRDEEADSDRRIQEFNREKGIGLHKSDA